MITSLSVIAPACNEEKNIAATLKRLKDAKSIFEIHKEITVDNDCSTGKTKYKVKIFIEKIQELRIQLVNHEINKGNDAASISFEKMASGYLMRIKRNF